MTRQFPLILFQFWELGFAIVNGLNNWFQCVYSANYKKNRLITHSNIPKYRHTNTHKPQPSFYWSRVKINTYLQEWKTAHETNHFDGHKNNKRVENLPLKHVSNSISNTVREHVFKSFDHNFVFLSGGLRFDQTFGSVSDTEPDSGTLHPTILYWGLTARSNGHPSAILGMYWKPQPFGPSRVFFFA